MLACAPKGGPVCAVKAGAKGTGELVWKSVGRTDGITSDVCTPLFYQGKFYVMYGEGRDKKLSCVNPDDGKAFWQTDLQSRSLVRTSPTGADGKIYLQSHAGEVFVIDAKSGNLLNRTMMGEKGDDQTRASIAVAGNQLFIRTNSRLFCVGK